MLESRIKLDPIDEEPKLPSPHLSAPPLPPIFKRPRPVGQQKVEEVDETAVAAVSQNLTTLQRQKSASSVASFPPPENELTLNLKLPDMEK